MALLRALTRRASLRRPLTATTSTSASAHRPNHSTSEYDAVYSSADSNTGSLLFSFFHSGSPHTSAGSLADLLTLPLRDRFKGMREPRLNLESVSPPPLTPANLNPGLISVEDARKLLRLAQAARLRSALREIPNNAIAYSDYVQLCVENCSGNEVQGREFAKLMDESGDVIVLGNVVFTRPEKVVEKMADLVTQSITTPNDPRKKEFENMEKQKAIIDKKACSLVRGELYCGLGFIVLQTLGFMRLTFWELSWDVMEPICFFITSLHFAAGYAFFLRTSTEPSFEGFFKRRFKVKQRKLMDAEGFDMDKYNELWKMFRHSFRDDFSAHVMLSKYVN